MKIIVNIVVAFVAGLAGAALWSVSWGGGNDTREYLLAHPEILPEAMEVLQQREQLARIEPLRSQLETPFPGAVLGNPEGSVTLVEFSDYACSFCRRSLADVEALIAGNPELKVVIREFPILRPESLDAARMALAAAEQGRFAAFHDAMFRLGPPSPASIEAAATEAGLDLARANNAIDSGIYDAHLESNAMLAAQLGINGTPAWIVGNEALNGAVGQQAIGQAIDRATDQAAALGSQSSEKQAAANQTAVPATRAWQS